MSEPKKPNNLKTALILASVALVFALGFVTKRLWLG
ncbi:MAG TPA: cytochrome oxidase small assembly protein [Noviherbaspirillum sp.]|nr:cytochrome oxidase small assembly protein [Noviherbaspirillum sp.]HYD93790.1 cytochrome oxidase small assembly protein [Noviherbaspirillum sp.]